MKKLLLVGTLLALASFAGADVLVDTMPGDDYQKGYGATIMQDYQGTDWSQGNAFSVSGNDYYLDQISAALSYVAGVNKIELQLWDDDGGLPGSILESWTFTGLGGFGDWHPPKVGVSEAIPILYDGGRYYVIAYAPDGPSWEVFCFAWDNYGLDRVYSQNDQQSWGNFGPDVQCAFRVEGTIVPEPGLISLGGLLLGAGALWLRRK